VGGKLGGTKLSRDCNAWNRGPSMRRSQKGLRTDCSSHGNAGRFVLVSEKGLSRRRHTEFSLVPTTPESSLELAAHRRKRKFLSRGAKLAQGGGLPAHGERRSAKRESAKINKGRILAYQRSVADADARNDRGILAKYAISGGNMLGLLI